MSSHWVFGYGSLMWRPGFSYLQTRPSKIFGYHRSLCVYSHHYRGTDAAPGLVLGLERGGCCYGMGFEVADDLWNDTVHYLRAREQVTMVYREISVNLHFEGEKNAPRALTYAADTQHDQYAGKLAQDAVIKLVRSAAGISGTCQDYVNNTLSHLRQINIHDQHLESIGQELLATT